MKTLRQVLAGKGGPLVTVSPDDRVFHALQLMSDANVGALLVLDGEQLVGIFSERDYARKIIDLPDSLAAERTALNFSRHNGLCWRAWRATRGSVRAISRECRQTASKRGCSGRWN